MFNIKKFNAVRQLKRILTSAKVAIASDLFENVRDQLHPDFISGKCGSPLCEEVGNRLKPIQHGFAEIVRRHGPHEQREVRQLGDSEIEDLKSKSMGMLDHVMQSLQGKGFGDLFDLGRASMPGHHAMPTFPGMGDALDDSVSELDDSVDHLGDAIAEDFGGALSDEPEEVENSIMPEKKVVVPSIIEGGGDWHKVRADVNLALRMVKSADILIDHILTVIEPTKYNLDTDAEQEMIEVYADVSSMNTINEVANRLEKIAFLYTEDPHQSDSQLTQDDRVRRNGPVPYNYQKWFEEAGESHHMAMNRLDEYKSPDNELMKLRIKDGERANKPREILKSTELLLSQAKLNNTEHSVKDNIETMLDSLEKKLAGRRPVDVEKSYDALLHSADKKNEKIYDQTVEARNSANKHLNKDKDKVNRSIEARIEQDTDFIKDEYFDHVLEVILDDHRQGKAVVKTAGFGGGIVSPSPKRQADGIKDAVEDPLDEEVSLGEEETMGTEPPRPDYMTVEQKLDSGAWKPEGSSNVPPTSFMQSGDGNDTIAMGSGPDTLLPHAAGGTMWNEDMHDQASKLDFEKEQKPPWKHPKLLI